jgi:hypothetical protein
MSAEARRALLTAALAFLQLAPQTSAHTALHAWLASWNGVGLVLTPAWSGSGTGHR